VAVDVAVGAPFDPVRRVHIARRTFLHPRGPFGERDGSAFR
jgi:hypothetical protein